MKTVLSFDVGTTSMKCILFNENFDELFCENTEYSIETSNGGIAVADPQAYFDAFCKCVKSMEEKNISVSDVNAVCFTTQGETLIPIDKQGNALSKAIVWLDTRAGKEADLINENIPADEFYKTTGLPEIDGALPLAKVLWFKNNKTEIYNSVYKFLLLEDYLIFRLTGKTVSEKSIQSSTGWYDIINDELYGKALSLFGIDGDKFPDVLPCSTSVGKISKTVANELGFSEDTVVVTGAMDQISSAIGAGNIKEGIVTETTGTALVLGATVKNPEFDINNPLTVYKHFDDKFIYMPYSATAGIVLKWFRDTVMPYTVTEAKEKNISSYKLIDDIAESSPAGSNGVILNPDFTSGGAFYGLTLAVTSADLARSVLEGVAFMLRDLVEKIEIHNVCVNEILSMGGGSYSKLWGNIKASVCNKKIQCIKYSQTTALGAAILGFTAIGVFKNVEDAVKHIASGGNSYTPDCETSEIYNKCYKKYKSLI